MSISRTPETGLFPSWAIDQDTGVERYEPMITPNIIREKTLFGIPLQSNLTNPPTVMTDATIQRYINEAISEIEHILDLYVSPVYFEEKIDYSRVDFAHSYAYITLRHSNVLYVDSLTLSFNNNPDETAWVDFPKEFIFVEPHSGRVQLVPAFGSSFSGFLISAFAGVQYHALRSTDLTAFPGAVHIKYKVGFKQEQTPALLVALIEATAAHRILSSVGPLIFPYNSTSVSLDGVSQGSSNPGPQFFINRIKDLEDTKNTLMDAAKGYYQKRFLIDVI